MHYFCLKCIPRHCVDLLANLVLILVIAYGAGGSGKTFTLAGPDLTPALNEEQFGIIPR